MVTLKNNVFNKHFIKWMYVNNVVSNKEHMTCEWYD